MYLYCSLYQSTRPTIRHDGHESGFALALFSGFSYHFVASVLRTGLHMRRGLC